VLAGRIVDAQGLPYNGDGVLSISVYDSDRERAYRLAGDTNAVVYNVAGPALYRGSASIRGGEFSMQFITPLDVGYRGASARVSAYAILGNIDAAGLVDSIEVSESQAPISDFDGPEIEFGVVGRYNFVDGDYLSRNESLAIKISDPSGVNLAGGIGHGITLVPDDRAEDGFNLTEFFEYDMDDYTAGNLVFPLAQLSPGRQEFKIKAWDNANNATTVSFIAEVGDDDGLAIRDLLNYPNPMQESTSFYFEITRPVEELSVEIYTLSGKNIWYARRYGLGADSYPNGSVQIVWNGIDAAGDRVATGTYLYRVVAQGETTGESASQYGKIVVLN
jgi:hypothetical protein